MYELEKTLRSNSFFKQNASASKEELAEKLQLKVEYTVDLADNIEAKLLPCQEEQYYGLIKVKENMKDKKFSYIHEIMHYVVDVGIGNKVKHEYSKDIKGKTSSIEEQNINYLTAAYIMPYHEIVEQYNTFKTSKPRMDELKFVRNLMKKYEQSETAVIRRISEVHHLQKIFEQS